MENYEESNMEKKIYKFIYFALILLAIIIPLQGISQVTIGSQHPANKGALLDLKENSSTQANSTRGLVLPRMNLSDLNNLYPMFESSPNSGTPNSTYSGSKDEIDKSHTGLTVYNMKDDICNGFIPGVYIWSGNEWESLLKPPVLTAPLLTLSTNSPTVINWRNATTPVLHIPSGLDLRTLTPQDITLQWVPDANNISLGAISPGAKGLVSFTSGNPTSWNVSGSSPKTLNFTAAPMDAASLGITQTNPWYSLETIVPITVSDPYGCKSPYNINLALNQTNYNILVKPGDQGGLYPRIMDDTLRYRYQITYIDNTAVGWDGNYFNLNVASNARWKSNYKEIIDDVVEDIRVPALGGQELIQGENPMDGAYMGWYTPLRSSPATPSKNEVVGILTFADTASYARFLPVEFSIVQCTGDINDSSIPDVQDNSNWAPGTGLGDSKVLKHKDQSGKAFYSAEFGNAGRWMITNLATTFYAPGSKGALASKTLKPFDNTDWDNSDSNQGKYAYSIDRNNVLPAGETHDWGTPTPSWDITEGLLYNWFAATGRDTSAQEHINESQIAGATPGGDEVENTGTDGSGSQKYYQGICPQGWHLPSDREWNKLEKEIFENPEKYSSYRQEDIDVIKGYSWDPDWEIVDQTGGIQYDPPRGINEAGQQIGHGAAMKEICSPVAPKDGWFIGTKSYSNSHKLGGLNIKLGGWITSANNYGNDSGSDPDDKSMIQRERGWLGSYWTSSNYDMGTAYSRVYNFNYASVERLHTFKTQLQSIRCVKDE